MVAVTIMSAKTMTKRCQKGDRNGQWHANANKSACPSIRRGARWSGADAEEMADLTEETLHRDASSASEHSETTLNAHYAERRWIVIQRQQSWQAGCRRTTTQYHVQGALTSWAPVNSLVGLLIIIIVVVVGGMSRITNDVHSQFLKER